MKKKERLDALLKGDPTDRVIHYPFLLGFCGINVGYPIKTIYSDPEKSFLSQYWTHLQYDFDWGPVYGYASYGTWEFGGKIKMPESIYEQAPVQLDFPVQSEDDIDRLVFPDVKKAGSLPLAMEFAKYQEQYGTPVTPVMPGVFTLAGNLCSANKLCRWMIKKPELVHQILQISADHLVSVIKHWSNIFGGSKVIPQLWEPLASNEVISPKQFEEFILQYMYEICEAILELGIKHIFFH
ncbi:unnamed protein product, partial [marine sediment metagenome]